MSPMSARSRSPTIWLMSIESSSSLASAADRTGVFPLAVAIFLSMISAFRFFAVTTAGTNNCEGVS